MKSKRAAAASEDVKPVDVPQDSPAKKRKRGEDDAEPDNEVRKSKKDKKDKEDKKDKKKEKKDKKEKGDKKDKKDKSKYSSKTRKEKKEERKDIQDLPEGMDIDDDEGKPVAKTESKADSKTNGKAEAKKEETKDKKEKKEKKDKKEKSSKKESKKEKSSSKDMPQGEDAIDLDSSSAQKPGRNIVFVGNLPYSATAASITAHFATLKPIAVRCLTKKEDPKACRGIAFVEFATSTHQRTCLDKFHHSMFEDGISPARKINVELTAGGGGKSQGRQDKIMEKNKKLDENRAKRIEKEKTAKEENQTNGKSNASSKMDIHPSRLARLPGLGHLFK
ncbi:hypothetical protein TrVFT333_001839 [Trichoderma virens FT-333]|nr:hypothetical protein TrVFT333_001839 [Trichoderma virens FT-333]